MIKALEQVEVDILDEVNDVLVERLLRLDEVGQANYDVYSLVVIDEDEVGELYDIEVDDEVEVVNQTRRAEVVDVMVDEMVESIVILYDYMTVLSDVMPQTADDEGVEVPQGTQPTQLGEEMVEVV